MSDSSAIEQAASQSRENQLRFLITVTSRHWLMMVCFTVAGALGAGLLSLYMFRLVPRFEAVTQLVVKESPWDKDILRNVAGTALVDTAPKALVERINKAMVAEDVARALVQEGTLDGSSWGTVISEEDVTRKAQDIASKLDIKPIQDAPMIAITSGGLAPGESRRIVEFAARAFINRHRLILMDEEEKTHQFVENQLEGLRKNLDQAEGAEWQSRKDMGFRTHDEIVADMERLNTETAEATARREEIMGKLTQIEAELEQTNARLPASIGQLDDSVVDQLFTELGQLVQDELNLSVAYQPGVEVPALDEVRAEIGDKEAAIREAIARIDAAAESGADMWQDRLALRDTYRNLQIELVSIEIGINSRKRMLDQMINDLPTLATKDFTHKQLARTADSLRKQFDTLLDKEFEIRTAIRRGAGQVERYDSAIERPLPSVGANIRRSMNFLVGAIVGLLMGFAMAAMFEMLDTSIRSIEDVAQYIGIEVIGTIPLMRFGTRRQRRNRGTYVSVVPDEQTDACIVTHYDPKSPISEAYRTLRTNFQFATIQRKPRTMMVTSAVPGEGKTTTAVNMAVTFADSGIRVLLIDTDLRRPHVHHVLKMERGPGLADVLREGLDHHSVIRPTRVQNLWTISSGRVPPNPSELIGSRRMERLMGQLGKEFDFVICDAPSILVVTDPVLLATHVDTVVIVVSVNNARRETVIRARKLLDAAKARVAGVVLNGLEATRRHYYYYYYYYEDSRARRHRRWYHL